MAQSALVGYDIATGSSVLAALERAELHVNVALWMETPEYEDGRLVISGKILDQPNLLESYDRVAEAVINKTAVMPPPIMILPTTDPMIVALRTRYAKDRKASGIRIEGQTIGNRFISSAYLYWAE